MNETQNVRWLRGFEIAGGETLVEGPAYARGYYVPSLGWADEILVAPHEVAALVTPGGVYTFSGYLVGTREAVAACLKAALNDEPEPPVPLTGGTWRELLAISEQLRSAARRLGIES